MTVAALPFAPPERDMTAADFVSRLGANAKPTQTASGWQCRCPAHDDGKASLTVTQFPDKVVFHCHAGCQPEAVCEAAGVKLSDLFTTNGKAHTNGKPKIVAAYDYRDEAGTLLLQAVRFEPKDFRQRAPDATAPEGWRWKTEGVRRVLYRLPEIIRDVKRGLPIVVCEGEKDVAALVTLGFSATCNLGGAGKWRTEYNEALRGADVYCIADKDEPGRKHAQSVAASLAGVAKFVAVLELQDFNGKTVKDASDFIAAGATAEDIQSQLDAAPEWTPQAAQPPTVATPTAPSFDAITADVRGQIVNVLTDANCKGTARNREIAKLVAVALAKVGKLYFHAERRDFDSAMFFDATAKQLWRIRSDAFLSWFSEWLGINRADPLFKYACAEVETAALSDKTATAILPESFWTARAGAIYLSNGDGQAVKITADAVQLVDNGTDGVLFSAGRTLQPWKLVAPRDVFETCAIFRDAHCAAPHGKELLRLWFYSLPTNPRSKPPICFAGEIGSGKTRLAKAVAEWYGLPFIAAKVEETEESNFWPSMDAGGLFTLDNADTKCRWLADALANAATDGCKQARKLYTNSETVTLRARAWLCVTAANPSFASDAGLADRLLLVRMARRDDKETSDAALTDEILTNRDAGLSHVAATLRAALADDAPTPCGLNKRHPDFAAFAVRLGRALGREAEAVVALRQAEADKSAFCLENDNIGAALLAYLHTAQTFNGTAAELVPKLVEVDSDLADRLSAKRLGKRLAAIWPHLQATLATAKRDKDRNHLTVFQFKSAEFAEFQTPFR